ncbi:MAG TPA: hypothetical protein VH062_13390 [Polyangiaceae bacterium]|nr:hypothetical protein [Polyangiaceae bacterium]
MQASTIEQYQRLIEGPRKVLSDDPIMVSLLSPTIDPSTRSCSSVT